MPAAAIPISPTSTGIVFENGGDRQYAGHRGAQKGDDGYLGDRWHPIVLACLLRLFQNASDKTIIGGCRPEIKAGFILMADFFHGENEPGVKKRFFSRYDFNWRRNVSSVSF